VASAAATPKQAVSSPVKSPATITLPLKSPPVQQQEQPHHTPTGFNDSGNLVSEMDMSGSSRKLSVESDSDKSTSSIPDLSKETCVQEALDFVEKLKMNYKESASSLTSVQSPSDVSQRSPPAATTSAAL